MQEIQQILQRSAPGEDEQDLVKLIQELKAQLVIELRKNHALDRKLAKLDKRIALLIKNRFVVMMVCCGWDGV
jgi:Ras GTPase-activating-like protein IQGAP2/3